MEELDEVDYDDDNSDFVDLEVDVEDDSEVNPQPNPSQEVAEEEVAEGTASPIRSDREEGEATPRAVETGASSDLEDGEFVLDSEPMQLEEAASVDKAAARRSSNSDGNSSEQEEEWRRGTKYRRVEDSPEIGAGQATQYRQAHSPRGSGRHEGGPRTQKRRSRGQQGHGPSRQQSLNQGFGDRLSDGHLSNAQGIGRIGAIPTSQVGVPSHVDLTRRAPPSTNGLPLPVRPSYAPPLEIRGSSNLMVHNLHIGFAPPVGHLQHLRPAAHLLPPPPAALPPPPPVRQPVPPGHMHGARVEGFWPPSHPAFDPRPPTGGLLPGPLRGPLNLGIGPGSKGHHSPGENGPLFRHDSIPANLPSGRNAHFPHPPETRSGPLHRGKSHSPREHPAGLQYPPPDLPRRGSGRMESLRAQLEGKGGVLGEPFRSRLEAQRGILATPPPPPPLPPGKHSKSPPSREDPSKRRQESGPQGIRQQRTVSAELKLSENAQEGGGRTASASGRGGAEPVVDRSPPGSEARTNGRATSAERRRDGGDERRKASPVEHRQSAERSPKDGRSPIGSNGDVGDKRIGSTKDRKGLQDKAPPGGDGLEPRPASRSPPDRSTAALGDEKSGNGSRAEARSSVEPSQRPGATSKVDEKDKEKKERETRARALEIVEAGCSKKRKERDERKRSADRLNECDPGTSGRDAFRPGLQGARREGRDKNGQQAPRNWRRHTDVDEDDQGSEGSDDSPGQGNWGPEGFRRKQVNGPGLCDQNGLRGRTGQRDRQKGGRAGRAQGDGLKNRGSNEAQPSNRRVVVGLGSVVRREDLERFPVRGRERAQSPGPPGFENNGPGQQNRFGFHPGLANRGVRDQAGVLHKSGSGPVVGVGRKQPSKTLAVDNLPENFQEDHILNIFERYGPVQ